MIKTIRVAQTVKSTQAEGPGNRFALWVQGCAIHCVGCCNPEMLSFKGGTVRTVDEVTEEILSVPGIEGVSFLGGEPTAQAAGLSYVAERLQAVGLSVMVYSGHTLAELCLKADPDIDRLLNSTDLLVDGKYDRALPETKRRWIGSSNQVMHFLTDYYSPDDPQFTRGNTVEIRLSRGEIVVNGWPSLAEAVIKRSQRK